MLCIVSVSAEINRRQKKQLLAAMKKARSKADPSFGVTFQPEHGLFSSTLAYMLPTQAFIGMSEDMMHVASTRGGFSSIPGPEDLRSKLLGRLVSVNDRNWAHGAGSHVNTLLVEVAAELLEVSLMLFILA